jgi:hypothetical protein
MYSAADLIEIRHAERQFFEMVWPMVVVSFGIQLSAGKLSASDFVDISRRGDWILDRTMRSLDRWRSLFCPSRVGLPLESEWSDI